MRGREGVRLIFGGTFTLRKKMVRFVEFMIDKIFVVIVKGMLKDSKFQDLILFVHYYLELLKMKQYVMCCAVWYHLYNLKKREKHLWKSVTFSKVAG